MEWMEYAGNVAEEILEAEKLNVDGKEQGEIHSFSVICGAIYSLICC